MTQILFYEKTLDNITLTGVTMSNIVQIPSNGTH